MTREDRELVESELESETTDAELAADVEADAELAEVDAELAADDEADAELAEVDAELAADDEADAELAEVDAEPAADVELAAMALEAMAHGRDDLLDDEMRAILEEDPELFEEAQACKALSIDLGIALREAAPPEVDLDALVADAIAAQPPAPSRRSLWMAAGLGLLATGGLTFASVREVPSVREVLGGARWLAVLLGGVDRLVTLIPGGWGTLALVLSAGLVITVLPAQLWVRRRTASAAAAMLVACGLGLPQVGMAQGFEGTWPAEESSVDISVSEPTPTVDVLRQAAEAAGLGFAAMIQDDSTVAQLHVQDGSVRGVAEAVLAGRDDLTLLRTESMLVLRPAPSHPAAPPAETDPEASGRPDPVRDPVGFALSMASMAPTPPEVPEPPEAPEPPSRRGVSFAAGDDAQDRVAFGGDVVVPRGERARDVIAFGGDAIIHGEATRDVVAFGGDIQVHRGAIVRGDLASLGGEVHIDEGAVVEHEPMPMPQPSAQMERESLMAEALDSAPRHGLLFLLGLVMLGLMRERHASLARAVVKAPIRSGFLGLIGFVGAIVLGVVLAITVVGIPGAILVALLSFLGVYVGIATMASVIGAALPLKGLADRPVAQLGVGVVILFGLSLIPVVDAVVACFAALIGFGAVLLTRFGARKI